MRYRFAGVSDTHIGCREHQKDFLGEFYQYAKKRGCDICVHAGDLTDGVNVYRGQEFHLTDDTQEKQAKRVVEEYPKDMETYFVLGNHDLKVKKHGGSSIGSMVVNGFDYQDYDNEQPVIKHIDGRNDMKYSGDLYGRIELPGHIKLDLIHGKGYYYTKSYGIQKYYRDQEPEMLPDIAIFGHRHRSMSMKQQGIYCFEAGCFQGINDYVLRQGLVPELGGWIIEVKKNNKHNINIKYEWYGKDRVNIIPSYKIVPTKFAILDKEVVECQSPASTSS